MRILVRVSPAIERLRSADEEGDRLVELVFWTAIEGVELLPLELEARHEVIDRFDLGIGKHRFVEGDSLGHIVVEPEERRDRSHGDVLVVGLG